MYKNVEAAVTTISSAASLVYGKTTASATQNSEWSRLTRKSNVTQTASEMPSVEEERGPVLRLAEHGGYKCAGCKYTFTSLRSLNHHRGHRTQRGSACEDEDSAKELRNIYRTNLPAGLAQERPVFQDKSGTKILLNYM